jgi:nucleoside-diphosphate-sugar epimerase
MKILVIGGTGFIGSFLIEHLHRAGHGIAVFHRGNTPLPSGVHQIIGDRNRLNDFRPMFAGEKYDLAIDCIVSSARQARQLVETLRGITPRVVALSSMDVYRAWGVFSGMEPGGAEPMPINEDSALRTKPPYPPETLAALSKKVSWADVEYDKVPVERVILEDGELPGTILRLPMVYGPGDYIHRFHPYLKRMDDGRRFILFAEDLARMRTPRGYVEDVAAGIALAATSERAVARIYNISEPDCWSELEWARKIAAATGWRGELLELPPENTPPHLVWPYNTAQHLVVSSDRIRVELGYREPTDVDEAFERTIGWERAHPPEAVGVPFNYEAEDAALNSRASA